MDAAVRIERGGLGDGPALAALRWAWAQERAGGGTTVFDGFEVFAATFRQWLEAAGGHFPVLARLGDAPIGMAWLAVVDRVPDVDRPVRQASLVQTIVVLAEHRNRGVGAGLLREVVAQARECGLDHLEVHPSERSLPFYRRMGFGGAGASLRLRLGSRL